MFEHSNRTDDSSGALVAGQLFSLAQTGEGFPFLQASTLIKISLARQPHVINRLPVTQAHILPPICMLRGNEPGYKAR